jgi:hypothetical protein
MQISQREELFEQCDLKIRNSMWGIGNRATMVPELCVGDFLRDNVEGSSGIQIYEESDDETKPTGLKYNIDFNFPQIQ